MVIEQVVNKAELDLAIAQIDLRGALCVTDARLLLALLGTCALPRHMGAQLALNGALPDGVDEMAFVAGGAVMLCAYQQLNAVASSLLVEQLVEVGLPVHHADLARGGQLRISAYRDRPFRRRDRRIREHDRAFR